MNQDGKVGDIRYLILVISALVLVGCPPVKRLYIHNKSDATILGAHLNPNVDEVRIRPGATKWISINPGLESCFIVSIDGSTRAFGLPKTITAQSESTGYGGRLDVNYEYGLFHFQRDDGEWVQLEEVVECGGL